jgi:hypothetical protein
MDTFSGIGAFDILNTMSQSSKAVLTADCIAWDIGQNIYLTLLAGDP